MEEVWTVTALLGREAVKLCVEEDWAAASLQTHSIGSAHSNRWIRGLRNIFTSPFCPGGLPGQLLAVYPLWVEPERKIPVFFDRAHRLRKSGTASPIGGDAEDTDVLLGRHNAPGPENVALAACAVRRVINQVNECGNFYMIPKISRRGRLHPRPGKG